MLGSANCRVSIPAVFRRCHFVCCVRVVRCSSLDGLQARPAAAVLPQTVVGLAHILASNNLKRLTLAWSISHATMLCRVGSHVDQGCQVMLQTERMVAKHTLLSSYSGTRDPEVTCDAAPVADCTEDGTKLTKRVRVHAVTSRRMGDLELRQLTSTLSASGPVYLRLHAEADGGAILARLCFASLHSMSA
jgi:hypothetical protein